MTSKSALLPALVLAACTGTDVGNPVESRNDVSLLESSFQAGAELGMDSGRVTEAWIVVEDMRLYRGEGCDDRFARFDENIAIDLQGRGFSDRFASVNLSEACQIEFDLEPFDEDFPSSAPEELRDVAAYFAGSWGENGRFELRIRSMEDIEITSRGAQVGTGSEKLFFAVVAREIFSQNYLDTAQVDTDGVVRIEEGQNDSLRISMEAALRTAFRIYDDDDGDGELDPDEYDDGDDILAQ